MRRRAGQMCVWVCKMLTAAAPAHDLSTYGTDASSDLMRTQYFYTTRPCTFILYHNYIRTAPYPSPPLSPVPDPSLHLIPFAAQWPAAPSPSPNARRHWRRCRRSSFSDPPACAKSQASIPIAITSRTSCSTIRAGSCWRKVKNNIGVLSLFPILLCWKQACRHVCYSVASVIPMRIRRVCSVRDVSFCGDLLS